MRIAIIGFGRMGQRHLQAVRGLELEVAGVCDQSDDILATAGEEYGIPRDRRFTDPQELLKQTKPECVIVSTTAPSHCQLTCLAAQAGARYVLCEKPMATSIAECDRMIQACSTNGTRLAINHQMRFMPECTEPKRIVQSPEFGGLSSITAVCGNIGIANNGPHYFEMFRFTTDEPPAEVTAWFSDEHVPNPRGDQFEDQAGSLRLTTPSGKRLYLEIGADQGHGLKLIYAGRFGQLLLDKLQGKIYLTLRQEHYRNLPTTRYAAPWEDSVQQIETVGNAVDPSRAVLEALLNGGEPATGAEGKLTVQTLVAAYLSHESGHLPIKIDDAHLPVDRVFAWA